MYRDGFPPDYFCICADNRQPGVRQRSVSGTLNIANQSLITGALTLSGTISGNGLLSVTGPLNWSAGEISGTGILDLSGPTSITGGSHLVTARTINNSGTLTLSGGSSSLTLSSGAVLNNLLGGLFDIQNDAAIAFSGTGLQPTFDNAGSLKKSAGTGTSAIGIRFTNSGKVEIHSGRVSFFAYVQSAGETILSGGNIGAYPSPLDLEGGTLVGSGSVIGSVTNAGGNLSPGTSSTIGNIAIQGNYSQGARAALTMKVAGSGAGQHDVLSVSGAATLAGTLEVRMLGTYRPAPNTNYQILNYGSHGGIFGAIHGSDLGPVRLDATYGASHLVLHSVSTPPSLHDVSPSIVGIGGKARLIGENLGSEANAVVVFSPGVVAELVDVHTSSTIVARVPIGAVSGPVFVATGVDAQELRSLQSRIDLIREIDSDTLRAEISTLNATQRSLLARGAASGSAHFQVTYPYLLSTPYSDALAEDYQGMKFLRNRVMVDLVFPTAGTIPGFDTALELARSIDADLVGYFPITNSFVFDLRHPPSSLLGLNSIIAQLRTHSTVEDVWEDMVLEPRQVAFADVDALDRYRRVNDVLRGRMDAWATDRIQAPGAWNLIDRFVPSRDRKPSGRASLFPMKVAILDSGVDQTHPEFHNVSLTKVDVVLTPVRVGQFNIAIPSALTETPYSDGDPVAPISGDETGQHGTGVASLIAATNGEQVAPNGDRGINGLLHAPMPYSIQVYKKANSPTMSQFIWSIATAPLTGARVLNIGIGSNFPINPARSPLAGQVNTSLRKLKLHLESVHHVLLLVAAAGNSADKNDPENQQGFIVPLVGITGGNDIPSSLGGLPNALSVAALDRDDQRQISSNWGTGVIQIAAPGSEVLIAGDFSHRGTRTSFRIGNAFYARAEGTSVAAPLVAGTAALLFGLNPRLPAGQVKNLLIDTGLDVVTANGLSGEYASNPRRIVLRTLKAGYAIRQLLLDDGVITNNQPWTGVSKVMLDVSPHQGFVPTLQMIEIRREQGGAGRAEGFALRPLQRAGNPILIENVSLTHDGRRATYLTYNNPRSLDYYQFDTNTFGTINVGAELTLQQHALEHNAMGDLLLGATQPLGGGMCDYQLRWLPVGGGAPSVAASTGAQQCASPALVKIYDASWTGDSRAWALEYAAPPNNTALNRIDEQLRNAAGMIRNVNLPIAGGGPIFRRISYAQDGNAIAYGSATDITTQFAREIHETPIVDTLGDIAWSPDGSELAFSNVLPVAGQGFGRVIGIRRDRRSDRDRAQTDIFKIPTANFDIYSISWQW